jgi:hypothetical protein
MNQHGTNIKTISRMAVLLGVIAFTGQAQAVSRVGNRISGSSDDFSAPIPQEFCLQGRCQVSETRTSKVLLDDAHGRVVRVGAQLPVIPLRLTVADFATEVTKYAGLSRDELVAKLLESGWTKVSTPQGCVESWMIENGGTFNQIAVWGVGKGVAVYGFATKELEQSARELVNGIELSPGACAW